MVSKLQLTLLALVLACMLLLGSGGAIARAARHVPHPRTRPRTRPEPRHRPHHRFERPRVSFGARLTSFARRLLGVPYVWGGDSPQQGFDCSGLVRFVYGHFGLDLPHSSYADFDLGVSVPRRALRPGDLVFFNGLGHVGIYMGDNRFIQAPDSGASVQITNLSAPWYAEAYDGARRLVGTAGRILGRL